MNKQQQIEEMVKEIGNTWLVDLEGDTKDVCEVLDEVDINNIARELYDKNYRKLPKDSVVLSREEYERLVKTAQGKIGNMKSTDFLKACISSGVMVEAVSTEEQVKQAYEKGCKETVEKFLQLAYDRCLDNSFIKKVEELAKQLGVEIKE